MVSEKQKNLAENLSNLRIARGLSYAEFSKELDIPKATLQSVLADGQTTLHTAVHISEKLSVPIDVLISKRFSPQQIRDFDGFLSGFGWFDRLNREQQDAVCHHVMALVQLMQEGGHE